MKEQTITDRDLRLAAAELRDALLGTLPPPSECVHQFTPAFEASMESVLAQARRAERRRLLLRRIVAVFLAVFIGAGAVFTFHPQVRAAVLAWLRETGETNFIFRFRGEDAATLLPDCMVTWLPEGYSLVSENNDGVIGSIRFQNEEGKGAVIDYHWIQDGILDEFDFGPDTAYRTESVHVHGNAAELYLCLDGSETSDLIWTDESNGIFCSISGFFSKEELLKLAENLEFCF